MKAGGTRALLNERFQMALNYILSFGPRSTRRPVRVRRRGSLFEIRVDGLTVLAPGIRRWRFYRHGFDRRLLQLACRYGLDGVRPTHDDEWAIDIGAYMGEWSLFMLRRGFNVLAIEPDPLAATCLRLLQLACRYGLDGVRPTHDDEWAIDIGAYMGEWSLFMLRRGFNVLAIEPDPLAATCLKRNLERHAPAGRVWLVDERVCVDDSRATVIFHSEPTNADGSLFPSDKHPSNPIERPSARLDDIFTERVANEKAIRAIKMDAEGAEPEVLAGATRLLQGDLHIGIDAGCERQGEDTVEDCLRILESAGLTAGAAPSPGIVTASRVRS